MNNPLRSFGSNQVGRHDLAGVGDGHELIDRGGVHGEGDGELAAVHQLFQLGCATNAADEVDALAGAGVVDGEDGFQELILKDADVELVDGAGGESMSQAR